MNRSILALAASLLVVGAASAQNSSSSSISAISYTGPNGQSYVSIQGSGNASGSASATGSNGQTITVTYPSGGSIGTPPVFVLPPSFQALLIQLGLRPRP
ncbi:MAG: hypothetical protein JSR82_07345 [Verrucomicrobia bacterium]|nr:hypothetical protein [Verrucomicrobiota bacterium]